MIYVEEKLLYDIGIYLNELWFANVVIKILK